MNEKIFGKLYHQAVQNLTGGIEYQTMEFKTQVLSEVANIQRNRNREIKSYIISAIISIIISIGMLLIFN